MVNDFRMGHVIRFPESAADLPVPDHLAVVSLHIPLPAEEVRRPATARHRAIMEDSIDPQRPLAGPACAALLTPVGVGTLPAALGVADNSFRTARPRPFALAPVAVVMEVGRAPGRVRDRRAEPTAPVASAVSRMPRLPWGNVSVVEVRRAHGTARCRGRRVRREDRRCPR